MTVPIAKRISAPAIIAMTIGIGSQRITLPISPVTPSKRTSKPARMNAPTASLNGMVASEPATSAAPGIE